MEQTKAIYNIDMKQNNRVRVIINFFTKSEEKNEELSVVSSCDL